jgi:hypothetical protein
MRILGSGAALASALAASLALHAAGCLDTANDCDLNPILACGLWGDGGISSSSGTGGNPACAGEPSAKNVTDACGVFAQADATGAAEDGSKSHPYKSLQKAIDNAGGKRVYACASAPFGEAVTLAAGLEVYGGFDCTDGWAWSQDRRSALDGPADTVALTVQKGAAGAKVENFAITAASPGDLKGGGSSIAVAVDDAAAELVRCDVKAGDAADGPDGQTPGGTAAKGADAATPDAATMNACVNAATVAGGAPGSTTCDDGQTSGGAGGEGGITGTSNGDGQKGTGGQPTDAVSGLGGAGEAAVQCAGGGAGSDGAPGLAGPGGTTPGVLSLSGLTTTEDTGGKPGIRAQGGGGGGGAKSGIFCMAGAMTVDGPGASGGGGGAGGCGGKGGGGGKAGGSSVSIVSLGVQLTLTDVTLAVGKGGKGGNGAIGQAGGGSGQGAPGGASSGLSGSKAGCQGGPGGAGGAGGPGGGGRGGHAIGIAYAKAPAMMPMVKTFTPGTAGSGGLPGTGGTTSGNGATGAAGQCWDFTTSAACQ